jgi:Flp pilus assembly protein TadG
MMLSKTPAEFGRTPVRRGWNEGSAAVETAIALSFLIPILFGIAEFGLAFYSTNTMQLVIEEVGRYAMVNNTATTAACPGAPPANCPQVAMCVTTKATQILASYPVLSSPTVSVSGCTAAAASVPAEMTIQGSFTPMNLLIPLPSMTTQIKVPMS